jgi:hypothetical protein
MARATNISFAAKEIRGYLSKTNVFMTSGRSVADAASRCRAAASADVEAASVTLGVYLLPEK